MRGDFSQEMLRYSSSCTKQFRGELASKSDVTLLLAAPTETIDIKKEVFIK